MKKLIWTACALVCVFAMGCGNVHTPEQDCCAPTTQQASPLPSTAPSTPAPLPTSPAPTITLANVSTVLGQSTLLQSTPLLQGYPSVNYSWTFGDGSPTVNTFTTAVSHTYAALGSYAAGVTVTDSRGLTATNGATVTIVNAPAGPPAPTPPAAVLTVSIACTPQTPPAATPCNVTASYAGAVLPSASITNVNWDFGDGTPVAHGVAVSHAYAQVGTYPVFATVTATTAAGSLMATTQTAIGVK